MAQTLFEKYGGFATVSRVVMDFYDRALDSDQIGGYFDDVDLKRLVDHQTKFVSSLMGGPASFADERLRALHAHLGISDADMDEMKAILSRTLDDHGVAASDVGLVMDAIEARRPLIVTG
jgi:hemoglobin